MEGSPGKKPSGPSGIVRRPQVWELGKQIAVGLDFVPHLPVCDDSQEDITGIVSECPTIAREGCGARGSA